MPSPILLNIQGYSSIPSQDRGSFLMVPKAICRVTAHRCPACSSQVSLWYPSSIVCLLHVPNVYMAVTAEPSWNKTLGPTYSHCPRSPHLRECHHHTPPSSPPLPFLSFKTPLPQISPSLNPGSLSSPPWTYIPPYIYFQHEADPGPSQPVPPVARIVCLFCFV